MKRYKLGGKWNFVSLSNTRSGRPNYCSPDSRASYFCKGGNTIKCKSGWDASFSGEGSDLYHTCRQVYGCCWCMLKWNWETPKSSKGQARLISCYTISRIQFLTNIQRLPGFSLPSRRWPGHDDPRIWRIERKRFLPFWCSGKYYPQRATIAVVTGSDESTTWRDVKLSEFRFGRRGTWEE